MDSALIEGYPSDVRTCRFPSQLKTFALQVLVTKISCRFQSNLAGTVNNYMQVTGIATGENFAFFIYSHFAEIL